MAGKDTNNPATAADFYSKGNEAFVNEDYKTAVEQYSAALGLDPVLAEALVARAHALIKTDKMRMLRRMLTKLLTFLELEEKIHLLFRKLSSDLESLPFTLDDIVKLKTVLWKEKKSVKNLA